MPSIFPKIYLASDHAGAHLKGILSQSLKAWGVAFEDLGPTTSDPVDYPDYACKASEALKSNPQAGAVLICGTGIGISIAANRSPHMRAAVCNGGVTEARLARAHNNANALCLGARLVGEVTACDALEAFLNTPFAGGRHQGRVDKLKDCAT